MEATIQTVEVVTLTMTREQAEVLRRFVGFIGLDNEQDDAIHIACNGREIKHSTVRPVAKSIHSALMRLGV